MEINLIAINVGNSRVAVASFVAGELKAVERVSVDDRAAIKSAITTAYEQIIGRENAAVCAASVNPPLEDEIELIAMEVTGLPVEWIGEQIELPVNVLTDVPSETGVDRVLATAAAYEQLGKVCIVVDAGTALTINCCNDNGDFVGGAIAPGIKLQLTALAEKTAKLPRPEFRTPDGAVGKSTEQAILHGVFHGLRGLVKETAESYATEVGIWPEIIATGGDAEALFKDWEIIHAISPDLTLYGIALAYTNHYIKHESEG